MFEIIQDVILPLVIAAIAIPYTFIFVSKTIDHLSSESRLQTILKADAINEATKIALQTESTNKSNNYK